MHNTITIEDAAAASDDAPRPWRRKLYWLWGPAALMTLASLLLALVEPRWCALGLAVTVLWVVLASLVFGIREGMVWTGSGMLGYGPDLRHVGLFSTYRQRANLAAMSGLYALCVALGVAALQLTGLEPEDAGFLLLGPLFVTASLPLDLCNGWLARRFGDWPSMRQALALWIPAALLSLLLGWILADVIDALRPGLVHRLHYAVVPGFTALYLLILIMIHRSALRWQAQVDQANQRADEADTARQLAEARLAVLQAQIEPHFLYNTLATVQYLLKSEPAAADFLLKQLIRYLRLAMPSMRQFSSTLSREFELTEAYLQITRLRMGGRLEVDLDLPAALEAQEFPPLVLQTLVENAIKHGVEPKVGTVRIRVFAQHANDAVTVSVQDDGVGIGGAATQGSGTGLQNIRERLRSIHGDAARLSITGMPQGGVLASVIVPCAINR
jgi:two-component sensor histidine kinase